MRIALVGQPNCGKSTLFNQVAGYKAETGNFSGTTVTFTESKIRVAGEIVDVVDLPGTYSLAGTNPAEAYSQEYLRSNQVDVILNIIDVTHLSQGLQLTLELLSLNRPLVIGLNMMDEAVRLGLSVDGEYLGSLLGVKVLPLIASKGQGVRNLFLATLHAGKTKPAVSLEINNKATPQHELVKDIVRKVICEGERRWSWRDRLDELLLHPWWGYLFLVIILFAFFQAVYGVGTLLEIPLLGIFSNLSGSITRILPGNSLFGQMVEGLIQGVSGGLAIVLPYLIPFLLGLGILEDIGYLPRVAFLMDNLMHKIGLHGKAIIPFILGYGCNVPAVMSTRTLEERNDRVLASALAVMVPCAARLAVVFGLVAFYLGPLWALAIYLFDIFVIAIVGRIITLILRDDSPGLILEMPVYRLPTGKAIVSKAWFRIREFIVEAWPLLIGGSLVLALFNYFHLSTVFNSILRGITWVLGLPAETGVPLIFGVLRKELSLVMLSQALGATDFSSVLTQLQMLTFTVFVVFYIPCLPTLVVLKKELGTSAMVKISLLTFGIAMVAALFARLVGMMIL